jgi:hypothetical protein
MQYAGPILRVIYWDNGHVLLRSQYRKDVAHSVDLHDGTCSCENAQIDKNKECKHLKFVRFIAEEIRRRWGKT